MWNTDRRTAHPGDPVFLEDYPTITFKPLNREEYIEIPWREIIGQRNILAHEYGQIDHELLYKTAAEDIPDLISVIQNLLPPLDEDNE